jgi:sugar phosphate isomerase/epimerase
MSDPSHPVIDRLGISTVCFRNVGLAEALDEIVRLDVTTVDLAALRGLCEHVSPDGDPALLRTAAQTVIGSGVIPAAVNADPQSFDEQDHDVVLDRIRRLIDFCAEVSCPRLILPCGSTKHRDTASPDTMATIADGLLRAAALAEGTAVAIAVEAPHYFRVAHDLESCDALMTRLDRQVELVFDTSHVRACGANVGQAFTARRHAVSHVQLRDGVPGDIRRAIGQGDIDFGQFLDTAVNDGYQGAYILELETRDSPYPTKRAEVVAALSLVRRTMQAYNMMGHTTA